jgi:hypothetical protein
MYRFRTIEGLLGKFQELENQEIYFASPEELNDPIEGLRDLFWRGDSIVWKNLIINYIKSLERIFGLTILLNNEKEINDNDILVSRDLLHYKSPLYVKLMQEIIDKAFETKFINELPDALSKRKSPIRRGELLSYFQIIHSFIIDSISEVYFANGMTNKKLFHQNLNEFKTVIESTNGLSNLINKLEEGNNKNVTENFFSIISLYTQSSSLLSQYNNFNLSTKSNSFFLISEFPNKFITKLESAIYPPWYSASFLFEHTNSSIWGHYGDNHKGVCLKFKTKKNEDTLILNLETEYGYSSDPIIGMRPHTFKEIKYHNKHVEIDFFRSIGRLNKGELNKLWYSDSDGNFSICGKHLNENEKDWIAQYWANFNNSIAIKLDEWKYEKEYRLVIHGDFVDYDEKKSRKLKYNFNDLEGIIFGIKTQNSDKLRIIKIIEEKCKKENRKDFDFFQAYYSKETGKIEAFKLNMFKFEQKTTANS